MADANGTLRIELDLVRMGSRFKIRYGLQDWPRMFVSSLAFVSDDSDDVCIGAKSAILGNLPRICRILNLNRSGEKQNTRSFRHPPKPSRETWRDHGSCCGDPKPPLQNLSLRMPRTLWLLSNNCRARWLQSRTSSSGVSKSSSRSPAMGIWNSWQDPQIPIPLDTQKCPTRSKGTDAMSRTRFATANEE